MGCLGQAEGGAQPRGEEENLDIKAYNLAIFCTVIDAKLLGLHI